MSFSISVKTAEEPPESVAPANLPDGIAQIAYRLGGLADTLQGPVLVVGYGNAMKAAVKACDKVMKGRVWVTGTEDKRRGFSCSGRAEVVDLGPVFDRRLFSNAYAILMAAESCGAKALLLADASESDSELLRMVATRRGLLVLAPVDGDKSLTFWVGLNLNEGADSYEPDWRKCPHCKMHHDACQVLEDFGTCPTCGDLYRLNSDERMAMTFDQGTFQEWYTDVEELDPIDFPDFESYIDRGRESGFDESVRTGYAKVGGYPVAFAIMESSFMMGSLGYVAGEKIARMVERATSRGLPVVVFTASGGARMQEGLVSLMQMAKVSVALERHGRAGLPYFSVITDPTTGGVTASFAMQGDIIVAEPGALIGFAGKRVIQDTIKQTLPEGFQTAEFALEHGLIDAIVERKDMRDFLSCLLALHAREDAPGTPTTLGRSGRTSFSSGNRSGAFSSSNAPRRRWNTSGEPKLLNIFGMSKRKPGGVLPVPGIGETSQRKMRKAVIRHGIVDSPGGREVVTTPAKGTGNPAWDSVTIARNVNRPTAKFYIDCMVEGFVELHGDRAFADDGAILGGLGWIDGVPVTVIAEEKGSDLKERIARNFGCPQPEGYRKSRRLMKQAEKFGRPIVCLVDTQGAFCGMEAEERGQGNAIAENLMELAGLTVPVISVILGEGGSGGALALALANKVAMQEHAVYSVLSPEGFASILWKDRSRAPEAAAVMKVSAEEAKELGIVEEVLPEGVGAAHENPAAAAVSVISFVRRSLQELSSFDPDALRDQRFRRFRNF